MCVSLPFQPSRHGASLTQTAAEAAKPALSVQQVHALGELLPCTVPAMTCLGGLEEPFPVSKHHLPPRITRGLQGDSLKEDEHAHTCSRQCT